MENTDEIANEVKSDLYNYVIFIIKRCEKWPAEQLPKHNQSHILISYC